MGAIDSFCECDARDASSTPTSTAPSASTYGSLGTLLVAGCVVVYAATYSMPSLTPLIAAGYSDKRQQQQLLLSMQILQNAADVLGRVSTAYLTGGVAVMMIWAIIL